MKKTFWDERFAQDQYVYGKEPNEFFKHQISSMPTGKLLLPGEGEGRNAAFAAALGWNVTAVDQSAVAYAKAMKLASEKGTYFLYLLENLEDFEPDPANFDLVAAVFIHFFPAERKEFHRKLIQSLSPGAKLVMEVFHKKQIYFQQQYQSGGPREVDMLYDEEILRQDFADLEIQTLEQKIVELNEGLSHKGKAAVLRLVAIKH